MIGTSRSVWGFDPRSIPGCQLWLDAADSNTVTLSGSNVTQWRDKSGNGNNSTSSSATYTTGINGLGSMNNPTISGPITNSGSSIVDFFIVATLSATGSPYYNMLALNAASVVNFYAAGTLFACYYGGTNPPQFYSHMSGNLSLSSTGVVNKPYIFNAFQSGTSGTTVFNGTSQGAVTTPGNTFTYTNYYIGPVAIASAWLGNIGEILVFNSVLTTTQRQQIEGYLAHKWGLTGYYDSSIPLTIPGCQLWLDGADQSSMTLSGSSVTQWNDKSGNGYHMNTLSASALWTGSAVYPTIGTSMNGLQTVNFVAQSGLKQATTLDGIKNLFWVGRIAAPTGSPSGPGAPVYFLLGHDTLYDWHATSYGGKFIETAFAQAGISSATASLFTSDPNAVTNATFSTVNMPSAPNISLLSVSGITGSTRYQGICYDRGFHTGWCGDLAEVITFTTALTTTQRQTIEGYLSKKWGIGSSSSIPSTHPFSSIRPHLRTFQPIDVPGCALWLDAADQSSLTLSGSNVTQWRDKSGNGYIAATPSGSVTQTTSINSIPVITIGNQSYLTIPSFVQNFPYYSAFFVMRSTNTIPSGSYNFMMWANVTNLINIGIQNNSGTFSVIAGKSGGYFMIGNLGGNPQNQTFLISQVTTNSTATQYINRNGSPLSLDTNLSGTLETLTASINVGGLPFSVAIGFDFAELLVYNTGLTTSQRQQVEGYLAHKWGLSLSLPVISPLSIPGCQLWFDAADSSTVAFSSGSNVSSWTNKGIVSTTATPTRGPTANQITYVTVGGYPGVYINNNGSVGYNSSTYSQLTIQSNFQNTADYSVFAVVNLSNVANGELQTIYGNARGTSGETRSPNFGAGASLDFNNNISNRMINGAFIGTGRLQTALISSSSALTAYTNATAYGSNTNAYNQPSTDEGPLPSIGGPGSFNDNRFATGYFHEILFYNTALTTSQRQQVEGYLARKWGISISATLPSPHPFKSFPPAVISETFTNTFTYTGGDQSFVVPTNVTSIKVYMWAGGGQGTTTINGSFYGGAGAYVQGVLTVTPGETLTIYVGQGGITGPTFSYKNGGYNSAGDAGTGTAGGRSGIARSSTNIVAVGAGGGGGGNGNGGAGGITSGSAGGGTNPGGGGTQSAGGSAGSSGYNSGGVGQNFGGGTGPSAYGGSGGDGFYGGGGGAAFGSGQLGGGGGGGSSLTSNLTSLVTFVSSNGYSAPNTNSRYYRSTIAAGGYGLSGTAGNGLVIITSSI